VVLHEKDVDRIRGKAWWTHPNQLAGLFLRMSKKRAGEANGISSPNKVVRNLRLVKRERVLY